MSLRCAILTALVERTSTGTELARRFDLSIGFFWHATHQQIYRELGKMTDDGLIRPHASQVKARGAPRAYEITDSGMQHLRDWVTNGQRPVPVRNPLLVRLRAAAALGDIDMSSQLREHLGHHRSLVETYLEIAQRDFDHSPPTPRDVIQSLILQAGIDTERAWAVWCENAIEKLDSALPAGQRRTRSDPAR